MAQPATQAKPEVQVAPETKPAPPPAPPMGAAKAAKVEKPEPAPLPIHLVKPLLDGQIKDEQFVINRWFLTPAAGFQPEDIHDQAFWRNVGPKLRRDAILTIIPEDRAVFVEAVVLSAERYAVRVFILRQMPLYDEGDRPTLVTKDTRHTVEYSGPASRWRIIRRSDKKLLRDGFPDQASAEVWLDHQIREQGVQ